MKKLLMCSSILALFLISACGNTADKSQNQSSSSSPASSATTTKMTSETSSSQSASPEQTNVKEKTDNAYIVVEAEAKAGSDGKKHDVFIGGDLTVTENVPVTLHFYNYDDTPHSYTAPELGINVTLSKSEKAGQPSVTTYTFTPKKAGTFSWNCALPCDDWAMSKDGYMKGTIKVVPQQGAIQHVSLAVNPGYKLGPDGKKHDAYTPGDFNVNAGTPVEVTIYNFDDGTHTFTNSQLGINAQVKGSEKSGVPSVTTVTFTPKTPGVYTWNCMNPCDEDNGNFSMTHDNFMMGKITVN